MDTQTDIKKADSEMLAKLPGHRVVVGVKQLRKALEKGTVRFVLLAADADPAITEPIEALCRQASVPCHWVSHMSSLGRACGIEVGAAAAAVTD